MKRTLSIDIETYSSVDLKKSGVYKYVEADDFEILLFAYAFDDEPVDVIDLARGERLPDFIWWALEDRDIIKTAMNANFEITCINAFYAHYTPPSQWRCSAVHSRYLGLPGDLKGTAKALNLTEQKDSAGTALINYFSKPCNPSKINGGRTRNLPEHAPEKWAQFVEYCRQDVEVERAIHRELSAFPVPDKEQELWLLDQRINSRGVLLDMDLVHQAIRLDAINREKLEAEARGLTGLDNPNSIAQLKGWLEEQTGVEIESLSKDVLPDIAKGASAEVVRAIEIRQELGKTSVKKYEAMAQGVCADDRVRGLLLFYGANRSGRWAGRLVQVQNLPQNKLKDLDLARDLVKAGEGETLELLFGNVPDTLSQLIRTAFIAKPGHVFLVSDFSAIEARVIAWLAGQENILDVFRGDGKIYEATAALMFKVDPDTIRHDHRNYALRAKGKIAVLACGFGGGVGAIKAFGAERMGMTDAECQHTVTMWREANPRIVAMWADYEKAAVGAINTPGYAYQVGCIGFICEDGILFIQLPSGRRLAYQRARVVMDLKFNKPSIEYYGRSDTGGGYGKIRTYGGKLAENITQATARDLLAEALLRLDKKGYNVVMHVHDEAIIEAPEGSSLEEVNGIMGEPVSWAPGLPLNAAGFETKYYMKD